MQHNSPTDSPLRKFQFLKKTLKKKTFLHAHAKSEMKYIVSSIDTQIIPDWSELYLTRKVARNNQSENEICVAVGIFLEFAFLSMIWLVRSSLYFSQFCANSHFDLSNEIDLRAYWAWCTARMLGMPYQTRRKRKMTNNNNKWRIFSIVHS